MELQGEQLIPAGLQRTWDALNDADTLKACIPGCESVLRTGENSFESVVAVRIGPVNARFKGRLQMTNVQPPTAYTINFDGQGGAAGFGKGSADVVLSPEGSDTRLRFNAKAQVGGRMAQIGSRLIDAMAAKLAQEFFTAFEAHLRPAGDASAPAAIAPAARGGGMPVWGWAVVVLLGVAIAYFVLR